MSRYTASLVCAHEGCAERDHFACDTRQEQREVYQQQGTHRCIRHRKPDEVLYVDAPIRETVLINRELTWESRHDGTRPLGLFWVPEGQENGGNGFAHGPGFKAWSKDFPEGTRLVITARIEMPDQTEPTMRADSESREETP